MIPFASVNATSKARQVGGQRCDQAATYPTGRDNAPRPKPVLGWSGVPVTRAARPAPRHPAAPIAMLSTGKRSIFWATLVTRVAPSRPPRITGFAPLNGQPRIRGAACCVDWRRNFHDLWKSHKSEIALQALERAGYPYGIERESFGEPVNCRRAARQKRSRPRLEALHVWGGAQRARIPGPGDPAKAGRYGLIRWPAFCRFVDDRRVALVKPAVERALRSIGSGTWLFAGLEPGAEALLRDRSLSRSSKIKTNIFGSRPCLAELLPRIHDRTINRMDRTPPWNPRMLSPVGEIA